jgi:hypothetical protein
MGRGGEQLVWSLGFEMARGSDEENASLAMERQGKSPTGQPLTRASGEHINFHGLLFAAPPSKSEIFLKK